MAAFPGILTSTYASMYNGCRSVLSSKRPTLAALLGQAGYRTAAYVTNPLLDTLGYGNDFDSFLSAELSESEPDWYRMKGVQRLLRTPPVQGVLKALGRPVRPSDVYVPAAELTPRICRDFGSLGTPFFLWVHFMDTHWPYHLGRHLRTPGQLAKAWQDLQVAHAAMSRPVGERPQPSDHRRLLNLYDAAVTEIDGWVAELVDALDAAQGETHIIVTADHGEAFGEHGYYGHDRIGLHEEIIRVPLIWFGPDIAGGSVVEELATLLDLAPTLLGIIGSPVPDLMQGQSFEGLLRSRKSVSQEMVISESPWDWDTEYSIALRTTQHKFIYHRGKPDETELYDLLTDPGEKRNIANPSPDLVSEFMKALELHLTMVETSRQSAQDMDWDGEVIGRLRALGYLTH
jgi:arylsulfatase A-like enzyme